MLGRSTGRDDGDRATRRCRSRHERHRHDARHRRNPPSRTATGVQMHAGPTRLLAIIWARGEIPFIRVLMRDMRDVTLRVGMDLDPGDTGQRQPQRQRRYRQKPDRLAKPAMQPFAEEVQVHGNSMPQLPTVLNGTPPARACAARKLAAARNMLGVVPKAPWIASRSALHSEDLMQWVNVGDGGKIRTGPRAHTGSSTGWSASGRTSPRLHASSRHLPARHPSWRGTA